MPNVEESWQVYVVGKVYQLVMISHKTFGRQLSMVAVSLVHFRPPLSEPSADILSCQ